jgi:TetR/AcrR family transcriptional regulator
VSHREEILAAALERFAHQGIAATSLQDIAAHSGTSKANVLYHFGSKENLIGEALSPSLSALEAIVTKAEGNGISEGAAQASFIETFVQFLVGHRLAIHTVVTHPYLVGSVPSLQTAQHLMGRMAHLVTSHMDDEHERLRFGVAISGATYALVSAGMLGVEPLEDDALPVLLRDVLIGMLSQNPERVA